MSLVLASTAKHNSLIVIVQLMTMAFRGILRVSKFENRNRSNPGTTWSALNEPTIHSRATNFLTYVSSNRIQMGLASMHQQQGTSAVSSSNGPDRTL